MPITGIHTNPWQTYDTKIKRGNHCRNAQINYYFVLLFPSFTAALHSETKSDMTCHLSRKEFKFGNNLLLERNKAEHVYQSTHESRRRHHWPPPCMASVSRLWRCTGLQNPFWRHNSHNTRHAGQCDTHRDTPLHFTTLKNTGVAP